jgi:hypothetical protein
MTLEELKFPVGKFVKPEVYTVTFLEECINTISNFPQALKNEVAHLNDVQLDTPYRPDGWTIRQVVHHCADSHMHSLLRLKFTLTEDKPTIKPYSQEVWAELVDSKTMPIESSLAILHGVHTRWTTLLHSLSPSQFEREYIHPEYGKHFSLYEATALYAWHCKHHLAHITLCKDLQDFGRKIP